MDQDYSYVTTPWGICVVLLRELRLERGIHQAQVADWIGKTPSAWTKVEAGKIPLSFETFVRVCNSFEVFPSTVMAAAERYAALLISKGWAVISTELEQPTDDDLLKQAHEYWASPGGRSFYALSRFGFGSILNGPSYGPNRAISVAPVFRFAIDQKFRDEQITPPGLGGQPY